MGGNPEGASIIPLPEVWRWGGLPLPLGVVAAVVVVAAAEWDCGC